MSGHYPNCSKGDGRLFWRIFLWTRLLLVAFKTVEEIEQLEMNCSQPLPLDCSAAPAQLQGSSRSCSLPATGSSPRCSLTHKGNLERPDKSRPGEILTLLWWVDLWVGFHGKKCGRRLTGVRCEGVLGRRVCVHCVYADLKTG